MWLSHGALGAGVLPPVPRCAGFERQVSVSGYTSRGWVRLPLPFKRRFWVHCRKEVRDGSAGPEASTPAMSFRPIGHVAGREVLRVALV